MHTGKQKQMNASYQASLVNRHIRRFTGLLVEDSLESMGFSEEDPGSPGSSSNYSKQDPRSTRSRKSCVEMIQVHWILRQMPKKGSRIRQDPGSWIFQILDPRPFLVFGTCPIHTCITHCHLFVNLCAKISSRYIKNDIKMINK